MLTLVVITASLFFASITNALFFPDGSHNHPKFPSAGGSITIDLPSRIVRRQSSPSSTLEPIVSVPMSNVSAWAAQTNQLCIAGINVTAINNPAGVVPCYNVLSWDPNTGKFVSEVRLYQVVNMEQPAVMADTTGSSIMFEIPDATITSSPLIESVTALIGKRSLLRRQNSGVGQINIVSAFYLNCTTDTTDTYNPRKGKLTLASRQSKCLLRRQRR